MSEIKYDLAPDVTITFETTGEPPCDCGSTRAREHRVYDGPTGVVAPDETATEADLKECCPQCRIHQGHTRTCPTQLVTREQRVALASHLGREIARGNALEYSTTSLRRAGVSDGEIREGLRRAVHEENLRQLGTRIYGDPAYGSWPAGAMDDLRTRYPYAENATGGYFK